MVLKALGTFVERTDGVFVGLKDVEKADGKIVWAFLFEGIAVGADDDFNFGELEGIVVGAIFFEGIAEVCFNGEEDGDFKGKFDGVFVALQEVIIA